MVTAHDRRRVFRIRLGVLLILLSWMPFAQVFIWILNLSGNQADEFRAAVWGVQWIVGFIGIAVAGRETIRIAKSVGWKRVPHSFWKLLRSPDA